MGVEAKRLGGPFEGTGVVGKVSSKLARRFRAAKKQAAAMEDSAETDDAPDGQDLIAEGYDPLYVAYILVQNFASQFSEGVSQFPELEEYVEIVGSAEDEYMPDAPPVSPLTRSYFCTWAFFDVRFGPDRETIGTCMLDLVSLLGIADFAEAIRNYQESRMGIYEHLGRRKSLIRLRELVTGTEYRCQCPSGYVGKKGELWYVRLCPPIADLADYHVAVTTPYVLLNASREDWTPTCGRIFPGPSTTQTPSTSS